MKSEKLIDGIWTQVELIEKFTSLNDMKVRICQSGNVISISLANIKPKLKYSTETMEWKQFVVNYIYNLMRSASEIMVFFGEDACFVGRESWVQVVMGKLSIDLNNKIVNSGYADWIDATVKDVHIYKGWKMTTNDVEPVQESDKSVGMFLSGLKRFLKDKHVCIGNSHVFGKKLPIFPTELKQLNVQTIKECESNSLISNDVKIAVWGSLFKMWDTVLFERNDYSSVILTPAIISIINILYVSTLKTQSTGPICIVLVSDFLRSKSYLDLFYSYSTNNYKHCFESMQSIDPNDDTCDGCDVFITSPKMLSLLLNRKSSGLNMSRLQYILFDRLDVLINHFSDDLVNIMSKYSQILHNKETKFRKRQLIATVNDTNESVGHFLTAYFNEPIITFESNAKIYLINNSDNVKCIVNNSIDSFKVVIDYLNSYKGLKNVAVFVDEFYVDIVYERIKDLNISIVKIDGATKLPCDKKVVYLLTDEYHHKLSNVDIVVHFNYPNNSKSMENRFNSCLPISNTAGNSGNFKSNTLHYVLLYNELFFHYINLSIEKFKDFKTKSNTKLWVQTFKFLQNSCNIFVKKFVKDVCIDNTKNLLTLNQFNVNYNETFGDTELCKNIQFFGVCRNACGNYHSIDTNNLQKFDQIEIFSEIYIEMITVLTPNVFQAHVSIGGKKLNQVYSIIITGIEPNDPFQNWFLSGIERVRTIIANETMFKAIVVLQVNENVWVSPLVNYQILENLNFATQETDIKDVLVNEHVAIEYKNHIKTLYHAYDFDYENNGLSFLSDGVPTKCYYENFHIVNNLEELMDSDVEQSTGDVYITHINGIKSFYVRLVENSDNLFLLEMELHKMVKNEQPILEIEPSLSIESFVSALNPKNYFYSRCKVLDVFCNALQTIETVLVQFLDYGNTLEVNIDTVRRLPQKFVYSDFSYYLPFQMIECSLNDIDYVYNDSKLSIHEKVTQVFRDVVDSTSVFNLNISTYDFDLNIFKYAAEVYTQSEYPQLLSTMIMRNCDLVSFVVDAMSALDFIYELNVSDPSLISDEIFKVFKPGNSKANCCLNELFVHQMESKKYTIVKSLSSLLWHCYSDELFVWIIESIMHYSKKFKLETEKLSQLLSHEDVYSPLFNCLYLTQSSGTMSVILTFYKFLTAYQVDFHLFFNENASLEWIQKYYVCDITTCIEYLKTFDLIYSKIKDTKQKEKIIRPIETNLSSFYFYAFNRANKQLRIAVLSIVYKFIKFKIICRSIDVDTTVIVVCSLWKEMDYSVKIRLLQYLSFAATSKKTNFYYIKKSKYVFDAIENCLNGDVILLKQESNKLKILLNSKLHDEKNVQEIVPGSEDSNESVTLDTDLKFKLQNAKFMEFKGGNIEFKWNQSDYTILIIAPLYDMRDSIFLNLHVNVIDNVLTVSQKFGHKSFNCQFFGEIKHYDVRISSRSVIIGIIKKYSLEWTAAFKNVYSPVNYNLICDYEDIEDKGNDPFYILDYNTNLSYGFERKVLKGELETVDDDWGI
ncbi:hypothetical protein A3Q56_02239 [Intoshia linei]|uniref:RNA helicase n=1 Tax=Intoshia linei TaxID=1819745 RepID=A0A177B783_9BILA|nr:hypothetical protein A3Q56_02239 [Intoshia linei]